MIRPQLILLLALLVVTQAFTSGYRFRCYAFCTDQSIVQNEYTEQRDHCRQFAQLKAEMSSPIGAADKDNKSKLISMFSDCMARRGWTVPDGKDPKAASAAAAAAGPAAAGVGAAGSGAPQQDPAMVEAENRAYISRASECKFARLNADVSANAAARAKACDLECEQRLSSAPDSPRPAACPAEINSKLSSGHVKD